MSRKDQKHYACVHDPCPFRTDKRKAIYTHLVRTHSERKEDYECEYCSSMFELDTQMERHLHEFHPEQPFTYTCVSRIEKVINNCAKLGGEARKAKTPTKSPATDNKVAKSPSTKTPTKTSPKTETISTSPISKPPYSKPNISMRTRASVNASLNSIAKQPKNANSDIDENEFAEQSMLMNIGSESYNGIEDVVDNEDDFDRDTDEESPTYISKPSGLKIKLSLKRSHSEDSRDISSERSSSPPVLEPNYTYQMDSAEPPEILHDDMPPDIMRTPTTMGATGMAQVRMKDSKYYDKLEVYHRTDEFGRRCCPFCDYKTSKNTIRVHLSGIHKIHFVKCSLCDYKAAFPHQITQHGLKFHKTTNMNVIQLSKDSRDKTIAKLKRENNVGTPVNTVFNNTSHTADNDSISGMDGKEIIDDEDFNSEESVSSSEENEPSGIANEERHFKPPKCQTSKTDYYSIRVDNGVYMYTCNLCTFQTPVRATIYTHKYRHEEKSYRCGYCDFTSAPRSNVVHHCRVKHKTSPVNVIENDEDSNLGQNDIVADKGRDDNVGASPKIKVEPLVANNSTYGVKGNDHVTRSKTSHLQDKSHQTIIKVPQFKRSFGSDSVSEKLSYADGSTPSVDAPPGVEYKLSLNKLYRINPMGSPKFMCALCPYACDTHPKMKHHLYRHRPQKYKCPYCDHRKYPRSYVVRHVRDTHRNKPVRVIDLSKGNEPEDIPEYMNDSLADDIDQSSEHLGAEVDDVRNAEVDSIQAGNQEANNDVIDDGLEEQHEEVNALKQFAQKLNLRSVLTTDLNDDMFMQSPDVSPNFSDTVYTSTPLIESFISGKYPNQNLPKQQSKNFEKKKSLKDYRVNYGHGPRYICNKCGYGTENYKTIHNHMYRHESQRYQCPYCGYRRSPKSFVENHIREVHKGHPVIVTELNIDQELSDTPTGSPRQCVSLKRKEPSQDSLSDAVSDTANKSGKYEASPLNKLPSKWPAPKPVSEININKQTAAFNEDVSNSPESGSECPSDMTVHGVPDHPTNFVSKSHLSDTSPILLSQINKPIRHRHFVERNRTTFKSIYKCVFDPETCNHISKDKSKMKQHLFMHVEYKPWTCDVCDMTASQSSHIKNHVRTEHKHVPETSFKYKRHNYLEKHIEGFLSKGLFTVPVNEYRTIMDMKGNTKSTKQPTFERDIEGNLLCPYCPYRTKSGGMMDHVKMKHMQPRFKCHWCDFTAFYKSEVRKHHRKEKGHGGLEFKTQELDLIQVVESCRNKPGDQSIAALNTSNAHKNMALDPSLYLDEEADDIDDDNSECSSSGGSSVADFHQGYTEYTTEQLSEFCSSKSKNIDNEEESDIPLTDNEALAGAINTEIGPDGCMKIVQKPKLNENNNEETVVKDSKFKCGYCSFSAALRVKVKMHSSKKHPNKVINIIEPSSKRDQTIVNENVDLHADDWKGTKFEQDLRRAGVSKLNLASLFPNSKRFVASSNAYSDDKECISQNAESTKLEKHEVSREDVDTNVEFKKPLEPVAKKADKRSEVNDDKNGITIKNDNNNINSVSSDRDDDSSKETQELIISNVRSLIDSDIKPALSTDNNSSDELSKETVSDIDEDVTEGENDKSRTSMSQEMHKIHSLKECNDTRLNSTKEAVSGESNGTQDNSNMDNGETSADNEVDKIVNNDTPCEIETSNTNVTVSIEEKIKVSEVSGNEVVTACNENGIVKHGDSHIPDENGGIYALDGTLKDIHDSCVSVFKDVVDDSCEHNVPKKRKHSEDTQENGIDESVSEVNVSDTDDPPLKKFKCSN